MAREILGPYRPLLVDGTTLYAARGLDLVASEDHGESFSQVARVRLGSLQRWTSRVRLFARVGRLGFHALRLLPDGAMVAVVRGHVVRRGPHDDAFRSTFSVPRGSRPLTLCRVPEGGVLFGEYYANPHRRAVRVFGSADARQWKTVHVFPPGTVRHVHSLVYDRYRKGVWVLTGDEDRESALWFTGDGFETLDPVFRGTQCARAVAVIPIEEGLLVPTDSPRIRNRIQLLRLPERDATCLHSISGSAFHALQTDGLYLVSTVAEPSTVNRESGAVVYASTDGREWMRVERLPPDFCSRTFPFARKILRYPELSLTPGENATPYVFGYGRSVRGADGRLVRWRRSDIRESVRSARHGPDGTAGC